MKLFTLLLILLFSLTGFSQRKKPYPIGMFGSHFMMITEGGALKSHKQPIDEFGHFTSTLNVLSQDGFNIYQTYEPNEWTSIEGLKNKISLTGANNMKIELGGGHFYKAHNESVRPFSICGENVYNNCGVSYNEKEYPAAKGYFRVNILDYIHEVFIQKPFKDIIWGYHIAEEPSIFHFMHSADDCKGNEWKNDRFFSHTEIPPYNVKLAMDFYLETLERNGVNHHNVVVMEANHHKAIHNQSFDEFGIYQPQEYVHLFNKDEPRRIYFEGSYTQFPHGVWYLQKYELIEKNDYHYLATFKSIDYAKKFAQEVHKVINIEGTSANENYWAHFHTDSSIQNGNWLWFQTYTSIIHEADGIWFWDLIYSWDNDEVKHWEQNNNPRRYEKPFFPKIYQKYVTFLAKELRLLDQYGLLSNESSIVAKKTDHEDPLGIVPPASHYIPSPYNVENANENYGLRYSIRTNGKELFMIITNPFNDVITTELDFSKFEHPRFVNTSKAQFLFESNFDKPWEKTYKTNRDGLINLEKKTYGQSYKVSIENKKLPLIIGPLDVKVIKFI